MENGNYFVSEFAQCPTPNCSSDLEPVVTYVPAVYRYEIISNVGGMFHLSIYLSIYLPTIYTVSFLSCIKLTWASNVFIHSFIYVYIAWGYFGLCFSFSLSNSMKAVTGLNDFLP